MGKGRLCVSQSRIYQLLTGVTVAATDTRLVARGGTSAPVLNMFEVWGMFHGDSV